MYGSIHLYRWTTDIRTWCNLIPIILVTISSHYCLTALQDFLILLKIGSLESWFCQNGSIFQWNQNFNGIQIRICNSDAGFCQSLAASSRLLSILSESSYSLLLTVQYGEPGIIPPIGFISLYDVAKLYKTSFIGIFRGAWCFCMPSPLRDAIQVISEEESLQKSWTKWYYSSSPWILASSTAKYTWCNNAADLELSSWRWLHCPHPPPRFPSLIESVKQSHREEFPLKSLNSLHRFCQWTHCSARVISGGETTTLWKEL